MFKLLVSLFVANWRPKSFFNLLDIEIVIWKLLGLYCWWCVWMTFLFVQLLKVPYVGRMLAARSGPVKSSIECRRPASAPFGKTIFWRNFELYDPVVARLRLFWEIRSINTNGRGSSLMFRMNGLLWQKIINTTYHLK